ncbi:MAG: hypothetical protein A2252_00780 [Elusimicrobia bacterium RIFOXYA2_FULL_39_19]|nr:MAG: hypothetical protein A2252_00780 [Elusimicrobia bacterium RIFOXYA2_FULL_39_19]
MKNYNVYWGDFHKHMSDLKNSDKIMESIKYTLDVYPVLCYPFKWFNKNGVETYESTGLLSNSAKYWEKVKQIVKKYHKPGKFITFLGYEWPGNRTRWGDHNVIYFNENNPLDASWELNDLYNNLRSRKAIAIPHHVGYKVGNRGKDWELFDWELSPIAEIYSVHGSSEAVDAPIRLWSNQDMSPITSGGTYVDALNAGCIVGAIGSNDYDGLPGSWNTGLAGILSENLSRESIWKALKERRTYAVTGDKIKLFYSVNGNPMGSVISEKEKLEAKVKIECSQALDRIELIHNGVVAETYCHRGTWERKRQKKGIYKILNEFGWGLSGDYGFKDSEIQWNGRIEVLNGRLLGVEPRFVNIGQWVKLTGKNSCTFKMISNRKTLLRAIQGLILEVEGSETTSFKIDVNSRKIIFALKEIENETKLFHYDNNIAQGFKKYFNVEKSELKNPDTFFHNAEKVKIGQAYPESAYIKEVVFKNLPVNKGRNYYYIRASQIDGQMAWSSPVWMDKK